MSQPNYSEHLPLQGQCFCGAIRYELTAAPIFVNCCHCRDCQAITGSMFSINVIIENRHLQLTSTGSEIEPVTRIAPAAGSHGKDSAEAAAAASTPEQSSTTEATMPACQAAYCPKCNTLLWATLGQFGEGVKFVRAGTLKQNELVVPNAHFFVRSKAPWVQLPSGAPAFDALPTSSFLSEESQKRIGQAS